MTSPLPRLLLIDDDRELCDLLRAFLATEQFAVDAVHDGEEGLAAATRGDYDLVVLDVMLPKLNGMDVLRRLRELSGVPVLMLTARGDDVDRILGLEIGADDYLPKPFNTRELAARIRAILRRPRSSDGSPGKVLRVADVELHPDTRRVRRSGAVLDLTSVEFDVLAVLLRKAGQVVERTLLFETVLERPFSPFDRSIDVHVSRLRKKLGPGPDGGERITTIRGVGYAYTAMDEDAG